MTTHHHTPTATITAGAVYIPSCTKPIRKGHRRVCAADEDAVTMAVEAGVRALQCWNTNTPAVDALVVALHQSSADADSAVNAHVVREALGLPNSVRVVSLAGADALSGLAALQVAHDSTTLVIAAEAGGQHSAAAAALVCVPTGSHPDNTVRVREVSRTSELTHERWTGSDTSSNEPDYRFLAHRYRALTAQIVSQDIGANLGDFSQLHVSAPSTVDGRELWTTLRGQDPTPAQLRIADADRGVAGPLAAIVDAVLHRPPSGCGVLYAAGSGQSVIVELTVPAAIQRHFTWYESSRVRAPSPSVPEGPQLSFPLESPFYVRNWGSLLRLEAASCTECGYLALPPSQRPICPNCHARTWIPQELPREGHVYASLENRFLPNGFPATLVFVLGELTNGFKYWAPMPPETRGEDVAIGDPVRLALRSFTQRDGITAYAMKYLLSDADAERTGSAKASA
jgi:hydroxymethylglutaryl-CoA synthase